MTIFSVGLFRAFRLSFYIKRSLTLSSVYRMQFKEIKGDLFSCPESCSLAHCVSEDLKMGKGIATLFLEKFGSVNELKSQKVPVGGVAVLKHGSRLVYYLITKEYYYQKPTYDNFQKSIEAMMQHCQEHGVHELAIPRLGCGLDKLNWLKVSEIIQEVFKDTDINISVYSK